MAIFVILLLVVGGILAAAALAVRFAGNTAVLAGFDLSNVQDMAMFNRWAGNRLLLLPAVALGFGIARLSHPPVGLIGLGVLFVLGIGLLIWLTVGAEKFRVAC